MVTVYTITVPGPIRGKGRPRFDRRSGRAHTDELTVTAELHVLRCAREQIGDVLISGPIAVNIEIGVPVPPSWSKTRRALALSGRLLPTGKPDIDNTAKLFMDSLNKSTWLDDSQVVDATFSKRYAAEPGAVLTIHEIDTSAT